MTDSNDNDSGDGASADVNAALIGLPVDERRPADMGRDDYIERGPGRHTKNVMEVAGIVRRRRMIIAGAVVGAAIAGAILVSMLGSA